MTVNTIGVIATSSKDVLAISTIAERAMSSLIAERRRAAFPGNPSTFNPICRENFQAPSFRLIPGSGMAQMQFVCDGNNRTMCLFFNTDGDHLHIAPKSIAISMGSSGDAGLYVTRVLESLSVFGDAYFDACDIDDTPMARLVAPNASLLQLVARGRLSPFEFENLRTNDHALRDGIPRDYLRFVGCSPSDAHKHDKIEGISERWDAIVAFAITKFTAEGASDRPAARRMKA